MNAFFLKTAEQEFYEAIVFYNLQTPGLGDDFAKEVETAIEKIKENPKAWTPISNRTRRCLTNRFPYGIIYQIRKDAILIVAVMHLRRKPQTWQLRLTQIEQ